MLYLSFLSYERSLGENYESFSFNLLKFISDARPITKRDEINPLILCREELTPIFPYLNDTNKICCSESLIYANYHDLSANKGIILPAPSKNWTSEGTICMSIYIDSCTTNTPQVIFRFASLKFLLTCSNTISSLLQIFNTLPDTNTDILLISLSFTFKELTWETLCFTFQNDTQNGQQIYTLSEGDFKTKTTNNLSPIRSISDSSEIRLLENTVKYPLYFKNILILNKTINFSEHFFIYWNNLYFLYPSKILNRNYVNLWKENIISYWSLTTEIQQDFETQNATQRTNGAYRVAESTPYNKATPSFVSNLGNPDIWVSNSIVSNKVQYIPSNF